MKAECMVRLFRIIFNLRARTVFRGEEVKSILVIRMNRIGDMICTIPLLKTMRKAFPSARITVLADSANADAIKSEPYVDTVLVFRRPASIFKGRLLAVMNTLKGCEFDLAIGVKGGFSSFLAIATALSGARFRLGYVSGKGRLQDRLYNMPVMPVDFSTRHQVDSCLNLLKPFGIEYGIKDISITIPESFRDAAAGFMAANGLKPKKKIAVFNISSNRAASAWGPEKFVQLGRHLAEEHNYKSIISGLPADEEMASEIGDKIGSAARYVRTEHIMDFAAICSLCNILVTGDGGACHVGAAAGITVVALFGATPPAVWKPYGDQHITIKAVDGDVKSISVKEVTDTLNAKGIFKKSGQYM